MALDNPFSEYDYDETIQIYEDITLPVSVYDPDSIGKNKRYTIWGDYNNSFRKYDPVYITKISKLNKKMCYVRKNDYDRNEERVSLDSLRQEVAQPLPLFFCKHEGNIFLLGTTREGLDLLSIIVNCGWFTLLLVLSTVIVFIISGVIMGVCVGYFENKRIFGSISIIFNWLMKLIESTPLLLWIIFSILFFELYSSASGDWNRRFTFGLIGFFSSPALGRLIADKIRILKDEDFIIALRLIGVKDRKIIFSHILKNYCGSDILFQGAYIASQVIFFDFTLSVLEYGDKNTWGAFLNNLILTSPRQTLQEGIFVAVAFSFVFFFFYLSQFFESRNSI